MKIKISQIKSDIQREKVGLGVVPGRALQLEWAASPHAGRRASSAGHLTPLLVSGTCWDPCEPSQCQASRQAWSHPGRGGGRCPSVPLITALIRSKSQAGRKHGPSTGSGLHPAGPWLFLERHSVLEEQ